MKADKLDFLANKSLSELKGLAAELKLEPNGDRRLKSTWFDLSIEYRFPGIKKRAAKLRDLAGAERLRLLRKLPSTDLSTGTVWAFNSPEMILHIAKQSRTFRLIYESPNSSNILAPV